MPVGPLTGSADGWVGKSAPPRARDERTRPHRAHSRRLRHFGPIGSDRPLSCMRDRRCEHSCRALTRLRSAAVCWGRMDLQLRERVYLVTGGSRGLGFAGARALIREGARVVVSSPGDGSAAAAAARLADHAPGADSVAWLAADNADAATPERLITMAQERFGRLDGALVSVGGTPPGTIATT